MVTRYVPDEETGAPVCADCAEGDHRLCAGPCEGEWCQCPCRVEADLAEERDDRPYGALANVARDIAAEGRPAVLDLHTERYGDHTALTAERQTRQVTYPEWQRRRACERKQRHPTLLDARRIVLRIWREGRWASAYRCDYCTGWHITSDRMVAV